MKKRIATLSNSLKKIVILPVLCLGLIVLVITAYIIYDSMSAETRDGLKNLAYSLQTVCALTGEGDYALTDGVLTKGGKPFDSDFSIVDQTYAVSSIDATIFWQDTRALTSIRSKDGSRALGTHAAPEVTQAVLEEGTDYFSDNVMVNDTSYFGYYTPLRNADSTVIGMIFVGKPRSMVIKTITDAMLTIFLVMSVVIAAASIITLTYAGKIIDSLNKTKEFLNTVAQGNIEFQLDDELLQRQDEIGEMGRFSLALQKSITDLVGTDSLTGLYNRRSSVLFLQRVAREYTKYRTPFTIVMGDIDDFKRINDQYGHAAGDAVLRRLASMFMEHMARKGFVSRWGGEEFLFIYERLEKQRVGLYMEELLTHIRAADITYGDAVIPVSMTFGIAECSESGETDSLLQLADDRLYCGKKRGKNCVVLECTDNDN